jgi:hypothetical protein
MRVIMIKSESDAQAIRVAWMKTNDNSVKKAESELVQIGNLPHTLNLNKSKCQFNPTRCAALKKEFQLSRKRHIFFAPECLLLTERLCEENRFESET